jgi:hypothetical protein
MKNEWRMNGELIYSLDLPPLNHHVLLKKSTTKRCCAIESCSQPLQIYLGSTLLASTCN